MKHTILFLFIGLCIASCHETDYPTFDDSVIDIYFTQDSVNYSFGVTPQSMWLSFRYALSGHL